MKQRLLFFALLAVVAQQLLAQSTYEEISANPAIAAANYYAYPISTAPKLTTCDKLPFYITHYGRHGSRFVINKKKDIDPPLALLEAAEKEGQLTATGREVLNVIYSIRDEATGRYGELTPLGAEQHRGIAHRMYERFQEVFADSVVVDAKSTVVIRCIISMENALQELARMNPTLQIKHDASEHDMYYMNYTDTALFALRHNAATTAYREQWQRENFHPESLMSKLFLDKDYAAKNTNQSKFFRQLFRIANALQNTELRHTTNIYDLFTIDELYQLWQDDNIGWFEEYGFCTLNGATQPYSQRNLLSKIVEEADSCVLLDKPGVTLRYGHDTMVLPLVCLMDINGYGRKMHPSEIFDNDWVNYRIFPMACNVQMVFYRESPADKDLWVKVLLNEQEATLPLTEAAPGFYHWSDVRKHCMKILEYYAPSY